MRAHDEAIWEEQRAELLADSEVGEKFLEIIEFWADHADALITDDAPDPDMLHSAVMKAFLDTEEKFGQIDFTWAGQLLTVLVIFWHRGLELAQALSPIELRLIQGMTAAKIVSQMQDASAPPPEGEST